MNPRTQIQQEERGGGDVLSGEFHQVIDLELHFTGLFSDSIEILAGFVVKTGIIQLDQSCKCGYGCDWRLQVMGK